MTCARLVVTADSELLEVDEETHADLFSGSRGGGGSISGVAEPKHRLRLHEIDRGSWRDAAAPARAPG